MNHNGKIVQSANFICVFIHVLIACRDLRGDDDVISPPCSTLLDILKLICDDQKPTFGRYTFLLLYFSTFYR